MHLSLTLLAFAVAQAARSAAPMNVLAIQSTVAYGHVGNAAATLPLQCLGHEVWPVDTVRYSNHPGHGRFRGQATSPAEVASLLQGLEELGLYPRTDAVLSGYLGDPGTADVVARTVEAVKRANPAALYLCDPVMGDAGRLFVDAAIPALIRERLVPLADVVTPNLFELGQLTGGDPTDEADVHARARALAGAESRLVVLTGVATTTTGNAIDTLAFTRTKAWRVRAPLLQRRFDGAGDCFVGLLLGRLLNGDPPPRATARAVSSLQAILEATGDARDLALVAARAAITRPPTTFRATALS
jgi:pyridoxine kinase